MGEMALWGKGIGEGRVILLAQHRRIPVVVVVLAVWALTAPPARGVMVGLALTIVPCLAPAWGKAAGSPAAAVVLPAIAVLLHLVLVG